MRETTHEIPAHISPELVVDFDFTSIPGHQEDVHLAWKRVQDSAPDIFWTPRNGGHWVAMRAEDIGIMQADYERFSQSNVTIPRDPSRIRQIPLELDPPELMTFRSLLTPALAPQKVSALEEDARTLCISLIEGFVAKGECEFMADFARHLPIIMFLRIVDLPLSDRLELLELSELIHHPKSPEDLVKAANGLGSYVQKWIVERRKHPGSDLFSTIVNAKVNGRECTPEETFGILQNVLFGGLGTVVASMGFFARCLAEQPELRRQLIDEPTLIPRAIEEMFRRFSIPQTARVITRDMNYKGIEFKKDELIMLPKSMYNLDERRFEDPLRVDFKRPGKFHAGFGDGPHRCPGSGLARMELKVFLQEWLKRIPDFSIKPAEQPVTVGSLTNGMLHLPLVWEVR